MNSAFNKSNTFKIVLMGPNGVGKSSIITRYCDKKFDNKYYSTVGVDYRFKFTKFDEKDYKIQIWDTAG
jgi:small GTP-binding protein